MGLTEYLQEWVEKALSEVMNVKLRFQWRYQDIGDANNAGYTLRKAVVTVYMYCRWWRWRGAVINALCISANFIINKGWQKWNLGFGVWSDLFLLSFCPTIPGFVPILPFWALHVKSVSLDFYLKGSYLRNCLESQMRFEHLVCIHSFSVCAHSHSYACGMKRICLS